MTVKLLTEHHLEFLSFKGGCTGSSESTCTLVKMPHCWKSHATARLKLVPCFSAFLLHVGVGIVLFVWTPQKEETHIFFICVALWVIGYSVYSSILSCK